MRWFVDLLKVSSFEDVVAAVRNSKQQHSPKDLATAFTGFIVVIILATVAHLAVPYVLDITSRQPPPISTQYTKTITTLRDNARQAGNLLEHLQIEMEKRAKALQDAETQLKELEQARRVLRLSEEDHKALQRFLARPQPIADTLTSLDFWIGRVALSLGIGAFFYWLGGRRAKKNKEDHILKTQISS